MRILHIGKLMDFSKVTQLIEQPSRVWNQISLFPIQFPFNSTPLLTYISVFNFKAQLHKVRGYITETLIVAECLSSITRFSRELQISPSA